MCLPDPLLSTVHGQKVRCRFGSIKYIRKSASLRFYSVYSACVTPCSSFQHAVTRNLNDKNAQLQKQLENVIREGMYLPVARVGLLNDCGL